MNAAANAGKFLRTKGTQSPGVRDLGVQVEGNLQQRTIFGESMPLVALRVSTTNCDCSTMAL